MSENLRATNEHVCGLLNLPDDEVVALATRVGTSDKEIELYKQGLAGYPGLVHHILYSVGELKKQLPGGRNEQEKAVGAFAEGAYMTFGLVDNLSHSTRKKLPNPRPYLETPIDTDIPPLPPAHAHALVIDRSRRGIQLPISYPNFFNAVLIMMANRTQEDPQELRALLFINTPLLTTEAFYTANFLGGAAEIILPLEREAQVEQLEKEYPWTKKL